MFFSYERGGRVAAEIEKASRSGRAFNKWRVTEVLPEPDGAATITSLFDREDMCKEKGKNKTKLTYSLSLVKVLCFSAILLPCHSIRFLKYLKQHYPFYRQLQ